MRPLLFRPPLLVSLVVSERSGFAFVTSSKSEVVTKRRPGEVGLYLRIPMSDALEQFDAVAGLQLDDRLLPARPAAAAGAAALRLALDGHDPDVGHRHVEELLDSPADRGLVRFGEHAERVLVVRLSQPERLLRDHRPHHHVAHVVPLEAHDGSSPASPSAAASGSSAGGFFLLARLRLGFSSATGSGSAGSSTSGSAGISTTASASGSSSAVASGSSSASGASGSGSSSAVASGSSSASGSSASGCSAAASGSSSASASGSAPSAIAASSSSWARAAAASSSAPGATTGSSSAAGSSAFRRRRGAGFGFFLTGGALAVASVGVTSSSAPAEGSPPQPPTRPPRPAPPSTA